MRRDALHMQVDVQFDWMDRIRILLGRVARVRVQTQITIRDPEDLLPPTIEACMMGHPGPPVPPLLITESKSEVRVDPVFPPRQEMKAAASIALAEAVTKEWQNE